MAAGADSGYTGPVSSHKEVAMARPRIVVVFGPWSSRQPLDMHWSDAAAEVLDSFAERVPVDLTQEQTPEERAAQVDAALAGADGLVT